MYTAEECMPHLVRTIEYFLTLDRVPAVISVFDQTGLLKQMAKQAADGKASAVNVLLKKFNIDPAKISKQMEFQIAVGPQKTATTSIRFISEEDDTLWAGIRARSLKLKGTKKAEPITDYDTYEAQFYGFKSSKDMPQDILPNLVLLFNSKRRVVKMPGFPSLMKEIAEFIECGPMTQDFRPIEFIRAIERYASIEQRWGL